MKTRSMTLRPVAYRKTIRSSIEPLEVRTLLSATPTLGSMEWKDTLPACYWQATCERAEYRECETSEVSDPKNGDFEYSPKPKCDPEPRCDKQVERGSKETWDREDCPPRDCPEYRPPKECPPKECPPKECPDYCPPKECEVPVKCGGESTYRGKGNSYGNECENDYERPGDCKESPKKQYGDRCDSKDPRSENCPKSPCENGNYRGRKYGSDCERECEPSACQTQREKTWGRGSRGADCYDREPVCPTGPKNGDAPCPKNGSEWVDKCLADAAWITSLVRQRFA